jgi:hypothetical protein
MKNDKNEIKIITLVLDYIIVDLVFFAGFVSTSSFFSLSLITNIFSGDGYNLACCVNIFCSTFWNFWHRSCGTEPALSAWMTR